MRPSDAGKEDEHDIYGFTEYVHGRIPEGQEAHGVRGEPVYVPGAGFDPLANTGRFQLAPGSPGAGCGVKIPNFSDGCPSPAPDIGAHQRGAAPSIETVSPSATGIELRRKTMSGRNTVRVVLAALASSCAATAAGATGDASVPDSLSLAWQEVDERATRSPDAGRGAFIDDREPWPRSGQAGLSTAH